METKKIDENTIEIKKTETKETIIQYDYGFLKQQLKDIQAQKDRDNAQRDAELLEVQTLLTKADELGIIEKVEDIIN